MNFSLVLLPYEITLFSNCIRQAISLLRFYYLMKLHYSQTTKASTKLHITFYYLMKLHYSQTHLLNPFTRLKFYYLMKLHYSQTTADFLTLISRVLLPYEITLFSNQIIPVGTSEEVLLPYEITLFSNRLRILIYIIKVLLPYEITLFSNY